MPFPTQTNPRRGQRAAADALESNGFPGQQVKPGRASSRRLLLLKGVPTAAFLLVFLATDFAGAAMTGFARHLITLPFDAGESRFVDVNDDGRSDLLAVDPVEMKLLIYRQRASGFIAATPAGPTVDDPDQIIELPPNCAWITACDVEAHPGSELLMSTATGLIYLRQKEGVFESERRTLVEAPQMFTGGDLPRLISLGTNAAIPVITATHAVLYERNSKFEWKPGQPVALEAKRTRWTLKHNLWTLGPDSSRSIGINESVRSRPDDLENGKPENDAIRRLLEDMEKASPRQSNREMAVDVNADGRKDLVLWQVIGGLDPRSVRTDVYIFLRDADGRLPMEPAQRLRCRGFPIPVGSTDQPSPVGDLKNDGTYQLILLEFKTTITSASSLLEMALSLGLDCTLTIRSFGQGAFSSRPDAAISAKAIVAVDDMTQWPVFVHGDFNGDGRPDFVVQRSTDQWNILFSAEDGRWFTTQPAMTFETQMRGYFETDELNGDGRSDIVLRSWEDPRVFIFLSTHGGVGKEGEASSQRTKSRQ
jgi:hypothetical protein